MTASPSLAAHVSEMGKAVLVAGLALLAACAVLLYTAERDLRQHNVAVQHNNAALLQLAQIEFLIIGVDYSARGYALTGEKLFFDHEFEKQRDLKLGLAELLHLADPELAHDIARLSRLVDRHAAVYAQFVKTGALKTREMAALITNPAERRKRYDALDAVTALRGKLMAELLHHQSLAERQQRYTALLMFMIVAIAFLGGLIEALVRRFGLGRKRLGAIA